MSTVTSAWGNVVQLDRFLLYTAKDIGIVIAHDIRLKRRWEWFWPQLIDKVPTIVLQNITVVFHLCTGMQPTAEEIESIEVVGSEVVILDRVHASTVWANVAGIRHNKSRIIARLNDDVEMVRSDWIDKALEAFNEPPHLKILGLLANGGLHLWPKEPIYQVPFVGEHIFHGEYDDIGYVHGSAIVANRAVWMAYYSEMADYCTHGQEDLRFTILSRADNVPIINFGAFFKHRGVSHQDKIIGIHT